MKFIGDVHLEHGPFDIDDSVDDLKLVLAGDVCPLAMEDLWVPWIQRVSKQFEQILWVTGNHEYYGSEKEMDELLSDAQRKVPDNVVLTDLGTYTLGSVDIACATLWSFEPDPTLCKYLGDFKHIKGLTLELYNELHAVHSEFIIEQDVDMVVTHHAPIRSALVVQPEHRNSPLNGYFMSNTLQRVRRPPRVWLFGHTHHTSCQRIGRTMLQSAYGSVRDVVFE